MKKIQILLIVFIFLFLIKPIVVRAACALPDPKDSPEVLQKKTDDCNRDLSTITNSLKPHEEKMRLLETDIKAIDANIKSLENLISQKLKSISLDEDKFIVRLNKFNIQTRDFYKKNWTSSLEYLLVTLFSGENVSDTLQTLSYRQNLINKEKTLMTSLALEISDLATQKKTLEENQNWLADKQKSLESTLAPIRKLVQEGKTYQSQLNQTIGDLSARQQEIINSRSGGFTVNIGDSELADDYNASIKGFRESAPGGYFGVFSFGAFTHRNGMSQYGALGRSKSKSTEEILSFYYPGKELKKDYSEPSKIHVKGPGKSCGNNDKYYDEDVDFQTYMKRIYEVPGTWPDAVLKVQAVAARSYAINRMNGAGFVAPNEGAGGQVYKDCDKGDGWASAVDATRSWVLTSGGTAAFTEFSSTTGGWINGVGWDTTDGQGGSNFIDKSYEKIAGSPWVYKAWYTQTYRNDSDKCGRSNPWLSPEEMADIVNAAIALKTDGIDTSRITPVTTACWGGNPYSMDELKDLVSVKGGISSANSVSVSQGDGNTNNVTINGVSLTGIEFKKAFNLRAPGRLSVPQSGFAFFNIERK